MMWHGSTIWSYYIKYSTGWNGSSVPCVGRAHSTDGVSWVDDGIALAPGGVPWWGWLQSSMSHQVGRRDGDGWSANVAQDRGPAYLCYGPYTTAVESGGVPCEAQFYLMIDNNTADNGLVAILDVRDADSGHELALNRYVYRRDFRATMTYQKFGINFVTPDQVHRLEFRVYWQGSSYMKVGSVYVADGGYINYNTGEHWDSRIASFPGVAYDAGTYRYCMVYEGANSTSDYPGDIGLATSIDGLHFFRYRADPIIVHNGGFEAANIGTPSLRKDGDTWTVYYHGFDWLTCQIGMATGTALYNLTKSPSNPIIPNGWTEWDSGTCGKRSTLIQGPSGYWYTAYEGSNTADGSGNWSTGIARSADRTSWTKYSYNPVIPLHAGFGNDNPEMIVINGVTYLYVRNEHNWCSRYKLVDN